MALTDEQVVNICNSEFENSIGIPSGDVNHERALAYDYYLRKLYGDEEDGLSKLVTSEVADIVDGTLTSLMRLFSTVDNLVEFEPEGEDDVEAAQQQSSYLSYLFFKRNPAFEILFFWCFDALVQKNGYVKAYWNEREYTTYESYDNLNEVELATLLEDEELVPVERDTKRGQFVDPLTGTLITGDIHDVKFERTRTKGRVTVESVPPENLRVSKDCRSLDLSTARMVGEENENLVRDDLLAMGFTKKQVEKIPVDPPTIDSPVKISRRDKTDDQNNASNIQDWSQEHVKLREIYIKIDANEDGRSELKQVFIANGAMLEMNDADRQPYHTLCPAPLPHKHVGQSQAEKVMDLQKFGSVITRQTADNLYHTNNPGKIIWEQAMGEHTMQDALTRRIGRHIRVRRPVDQALKDDVVPFMAGESFAMLEWIDRKKQERTGIGFDSEGMTPEALKNIQISVMAEANDIKRMKVELVARLFAETGIKSLFLHMHELVLKHQQDADVFRLNDSFVPVNPKEWHTRYDMTAVIGLGIANRDRNLIHLNAIWDKQAQLGEALQGRLVVKPKHMYNTLTEIVKNANIGKPPAMFAEDPGDQVAPPQTDEQMQLAKQQQQIDAAAEANKQRKNELDRQELVLKGREQEANHRIEIAKLHEQREARFDKLHMANQELRNDLAKMGHEISADKAAQLIDSLVKRAQALESRARADEATARATKTRAETRALNVETDATESGIKELVEDLDDAEGTE